MKDATLCFLIKGEEVLLLNRQKSPFMGMWNAVGGKSEDGESPLFCARREIREETGYDVKDLTLLSVFTWNQDDQVSYCYVGELSDADVKEIYPQKTREGILDFVKIDWVLNEKNYGVIADLRVFLELAKTKTRKDMHLIYDGANLVSVENRDYKSLEK